MLATDGTWREAEDVADDWRGAVAPALVASLVLALAVGAFLFARRVTGALDTPLAPAPLILTAGGLLAWSAAIRWRLRDRRADWLSALVLALFAVACSFPGNRVIDSLVWVTVFAAYGLIPARRSSPAIGSVSSPDQLIQQLTRSRTADGCETVRGTLLAEFAPGERVVVLHVAFCPPFDRLPTVEAEVANGPACDVKVAQVLHQGARLEARLSRASSTAQRVTIEILATDHPPQEV
jgi:hypothetical protein